MYHLVTGLIFGVVLGAVVFLDPFTHHFPPPFDAIWPFFHKGLGLLFMLGGALVAFKGMRLLKDGGGWRVEVSGGKLIYQVPQASRERSFEISLAEIAAFVTEIADADSQADDVNYLLTLAGEKLHVGFGENMLNVDKLRRALIKAGVRAVTKGPGGA